MNKNHYKSRFNYLDYRLEMNLMNRQIHYNLNILNIFYVIRMLIQLFSSF